MTFKANNTELLTDKNGDTWQLRMQQALQLHDLWQPIANGLSLIKGEPLEP